jgi:hypothetical protein
MKTSAELLQEFEDATNAYLDIVTTLNQDEINTVPSPGSWTAAQVTEHLRLSDNGMLQTLNGPVQPTQRPIDEMVPQLSATFLDFSTKLPSPDFIIPENKTYHRDNLIDTFKNGRAQLAKAIKEMDLSATCYQPIFGEPTRYEVISFVIFHTLRHVNQVKHINEKLAAV